MTDRDWTLAEIRDAVATGETSAAEVCDQYLRRISTIDPQLNAFTAVFEEASYLSRSSS